MFKNHLKIAWRNLRKRKSSTLINIIGLAIGFSCSILIFLFVSHHLQYDNFHKNPDRIYRVVTELHRDDIGYRASVPPGFAEAFRTDYDYAEKVANIVSWEDQLISDITQAGEERFKEDIAFTEPQFFDILNFPLRERLTERSLVEPNTAFITESTAQRLYKGENPLGRTFVLDNLETIEIIGVLEDLPENTVINADIFLSYKTVASYNDFLASGTWGGIMSSLQCYALLNPNQNRADIEAVLPELVEKHRSGRKNVHHYKLQPLADIHFNAKYPGSIDSDLLWIFALIGLFLIGIACINFINISSAQSFIRSKEIGIRRVLGSHKGHLFWQFISETFLIGFFAMLVGVVIAIMALPHLNSLFELQLSLYSLLDFKTVVFLLFLLFAVSFVSGSYPAVLLARIVPVLALKGKFDQRDAGGQGTRKVLVTVQFAISIMLIVGTLVIAKQIDYAVNADLGFDKEAILMVDIPEELETERLNGLKERILGISGVTKATACLSSPGAAKNDWGTAVRYHNRPENEEFSIQAKLADEDYVNAFGLKLIAGRNFYASDSIQEVVVNQTLAKKLGLASVEELLGKKLTVSGTPASIVGVVADFHDQNFHEAISPIFIAPNKDAYSELAIKINGRDVKSTLEAIMERWQVVFPKYIYDYRFMDDRVAEQYESEQRLLALSKVFSVLAIFICCMGLYGIISFFVAQRTREIGIRRVLGGTIGHILGLFTIDFFKLILIAGLIASPLTWYFMNNWLEGYLYRTTLSWWVFVVAIGGVVLITLTTIGYQVIKAALADPVKSLRTE
ncbi:ABC transporter permease [Ulvibacterium marinum]|uniref:ABC transporter permease n=1 Tax=Ulvibacterium marinum TaxID=2419782 RepID=UPI0024954A36|nr:ABC transporter permease [Ulvibacterium marinum]